MFLYILTIKVATADRLTGLIATRVRDAQCHQVCGHLEDASDYAECRALCFGHHETQRLLCRLPACDAVCQTACASNTGVKQEIQEFTLDGCTLAWKTNGQTKSNSILTGQDHWGRFSVVYEGSGTDQYKLDALTARKWRKFTVFVVGRSGLESSQSIQLDKPVHCNQSSPPAVQPISQETKIWMITGSVMTIVICFALILLVRLSVSCSIKRVDVTAPIPSISGDYCCEPKPVFRSQQLLQHTYEDYKIYEDISYDASPRGRQPFQASFLSSPV